MFTVVEGRRAATRVEIAGLPPELPLSTARAQVQLADGAPFDYDTYDAAKQPLTALMQDAGYARAKIEGQVGRSSVQGASRQRRSAAPR